MVAGFYRIAFTGSHGSGFGILVLQDGAIAGADVGGAMYDGVYKTDASGNSLILNVIMRAPAGITPVHTGVPLTAPADLPITATIPIDLAGGAPILLETQLGKVNVIFSKIRDFS